ncbi:D-3-phosphoglycerate dehydrogenase [Lamellibrachia satsuma]|nr:D-3-phosphoglycerate dehydrogenase [Lamellibrachia satsuma]
MQAFGMTTIGFDPITPPEVAASFGVKSMSLDEIWPQADYITVHTPLIPQTKNLLNDTTLGQCKKGVKVINCARGGIIDEDALLRALESGQCGGAALDVFVQEPPTESPIIKHPKVTCTPHLGASTLEAQSRVAEDIAKQFVDMVKGKELFGAINAAALANALSPNTRPYVSLGTALGQLGSALLGDISKDTQVRLVTYGSGLENAASYLGAAVLVGVLRPKSQNGLNLVSAPAVAKEMGLQVSTEHVASTPEGISELVTVTIQQPGGATYTLSGLIGAGIPLLVTLNNATFSPRVALEGTNLVYCSPSGTSVLGTVVGAVTGAGSTVTSFSSSAPSDNLTWSLMQVAPPLSSLDTIKSSVKCVQQVAF